MRYLFVLVGLAACSLTGWAQGDFTKTMTPAEVEATGLGKLSADELGRLKAVIERYKSGEVAVVRQEAEQAVAAVKQEAEQKVVAAETKVKAAEAKVVEPKKKQPAWLGALAVLKRTAEKPDKDEAVESRIAGLFTGWRSRTNFSLENGQVWQQVDGEPYVGVKLDSPAVRIYPGMLGTFWMKVEGVRPPVKVKPVKLE